MTIVEASKEGIWMKSLTTNIIFQENKTIIFCYSLKAILLIKD